MEEERQPQSSIAPWEERRDTLTPEEQEDLRRRAREKIAFAREYFRKNPL